jgi:hypothetical protein
MSRSLFTAYPDLKYVNTFSKHVAGALFKIYPQWLPYAVARSNEYENWLEVHIPAPVLSYQTGLIISTADERITIYFDPYHAHFGEWEGITVRDASTAALSFIQAILEEKVVVVKKEAGGITWLAPEDIAALPLGDIVFSRSWRGTFDHATDQ